MRPHRTHESLLVAKQTLYAICMNLTPVGLQVSFVNSICTSKGGTHVDLLANQICK